MSFNYNTITCNNANIVFISFNSQITGITQVSTLLGTINPSPSLEQNFKLIVKEAENAYINIDTLGNVTLNTSDSSFGIQSTCTPMFSQSFCYFSIVDYQIVN